MMNRTRRPTLPRGPWSSRGFASLTLLLVPLLVGAVSRAAEEQRQRAAVKSESFDKDPGWEGHNNRIIPDHLPTVTQDFGFVETNLAGKAAGEMGGVVTRAAEPAFYADRIGPVTLDQPLSASGTFAISQTTPGGGIFFGF